MARLNRVPADALVLTPLGVIIVLRQSGPVCVPDEPACRYGDWLLLLRAL